MAELTGMLDLASWPEGCGFIVGKERPHRGAQLRFTAFATSTKGGQLADLELRHRRRARCEGRIRFARTPGCATFQGFTRTRYWCEITAMAFDLLAWMQMLALTGKARRWEPKRLRLRIIICAGRIIRGGCRLKLRLAARAGRQP